jgi:hypothetical protein
MNQDGKTKQYVGYGDATKSGPCGSQTECPGFINTISSGPGCYMACSHQLMYDKTTSFYLLNHSNLVWIPSNTTAMRTLSGAIEVGTITATPFLIGRIKSNGFWTIGKIYNGGAGGYDFYIHAGGKCVPYTTGFEVLSCTPLITTTTTTTTPTTTTTTTTTTPTTTTTTTTTPTTTTTETLPSSCSKLRNQAMKLKFLFLVKPTE